MTLSVLASLINRGKQGWEPENDKSRGVCGEWINASTVISEDRSQFFHCSFQGSTTLSHFVYVSNSNLKCAFISCLFYKISATMAYYALRIENIAFCVISGSCFHSITASHTYGTGVNNAWYLDSISVNSSICTQSLIIASPYSRGSEEYTFYHNNHSHLTAKNSRSCYCHVRTPKERDDVSCFFSGTSCVGANSIDLNSVISDCVISRFNFINNTESTFPT